MSDPTVNLYGQVYEQIVGKALAGSGKLFQLVNPMEDWTWQPASYGFIQPEVYRFVGQVPTWSAVGAYVPSASDMHQVYLQVLTLVNAAGTGVIDDKIRQANEDVTRAQNKLESDTLMANSNYSQYRALALADGKEPEAYDAWIDANWKTVFEQDRAAYQEALDALSKAIGEKNAGLKQAIDAATPPTDPNTPKPGFVKAFVGGSTVARPNYTFPDPGEWAGKVALRGGESLKINVSASASSSALEKSWAGGSTGLESGFFSFYSGGGWSRISLAQYDKSVEVAITLKAYNLFEVGPDPKWFDAALLKKLAKDNNWNPPYSTSGAQPVFGKGGVFPLMLTGIVGVMQPSIDITMSEATYSKYKEHFDASTGIRIGPFQIGGFGSQAEKELKKNSDNKKFHVESSATYPSILGIVVANPGGV
jgi:hypothetical protein